MKKPVTIFLFTVFAAAGCGEVRGPAGVGLASYAAPSRDATFTSVTDHYGPLLLRAGSYDADADRRPWSGYWLPMRDNYLFEARNGTPAPLQKYDQYARSRGVKSRAADYERNSPDLYDRDAAKWAGRCDAWALASIAEPEPRQDRTINGVTFTVADQKALLISSYEHVDVPNFGQAFRDGFDSDYQDIYPDQFHRFIQAELIDKHRAFFIDADPGQEIWNQPIWGVHSEVIQDTADPRILHVVTSLTGTKMIFKIDGPAAEDPSGLSTPLHPIPPVSITYTYDLFGDLQPDGGVLVTYGQWTGDSRRIHPDFVTAVPEKVQRNSLNHELDFGLIDEIVGKTPVPTDFALELM